MFIDCGNHGRALAAQICRHIARDEGRGFHFEPFALTAYPDAWCDRCNASIESEGWTIEVQRRCDFAEVCGICWQTLCELRRPRLDAVNNDDRACARDLIQSSRRAMDDRFGSDWSEGTFRRDLAGGFALLRPDKPTINGREVILGSTSAAENTWLWGWANPTVPPLLGAPGVAVRRHGETTRKKLLCSPSADLDAAHVACGLALEHLKGTVVLELRKGQLTQFVALFDVRTDEVPPDEVTQDQVDLCAAHGVPRLPPDPYMNVGIARNVRTNDLGPLNGLRHAVEGRGCGWFLWAGTELGQEGDFFKPVPALYVSDWCAEAQRYLGLPPGWRFLTDGDREDVWEDESLLDL